MRLLRQLVLVLACLPLINGSTPMVTAGDDNPDTSAVLRLMGHGSAHACPVGDRVITAAHVVDDGKPYRWSDLQGHEGVVDLDVSDRCADIAWMKLRSGSVTFYPLAKAAPVVGDRVWLLGFDMSSKSKAFGPKVIDSKVVNVTAGHLILSDHGKPGSSGTCVFNASGEVVGINSGGNRLDREVDIVGRVVGIYGDWLSSCVEEAK